jgi:serine/threonine-protein kinase
MWEGLKIGDVLAHRYRIEECIGTGGMGRVFAARDLKLPDKRWAVKEVRVTGGGQGMLAPGEVNMLLKLNHPQLPKIVDYYHVAEAGLSYLVMEFIQGKTVGRLVEESGRVAEDLVIRFGMQLCNIFAYLHGLKPEPIIHRDLKPDNVIIDDRNVVHLIDFGISRTYKSDKAHDTILLGSPGFLAPEQIKGAQSGVKTDLYQLGAILFYMLSGGLRYDEDAGWEACAHVSEPLRDLLRRLLHEQPELRPEKAEDVCAELAMIGAVGNASAQAAENGNASGHRAARIGMRLGYLLVGGAYEGAGATATALALAETLSLAGLRVGLVEYAHTPELVYRLGGERFAPERYTYLTERGHARVGDSSAQEWVNGNIICYPLRPDMSAAMFTAEQWYRSLFSVRADAVVIDAGNHWQDEFVQDLMRRADHVVFVIDGRMHKWYRKDAETAVEQLAELRTMRKGVHTIAYSREPHSSAWRSFPLPLDLKLAPDANGEVPRNAFAPLVKKWGVELPDARKKRWFFGRSAGIQ